jgi:hypothetical protein
MGNICEVPCISQVFILYCYYSSYILLHRALLQFITLAGKFHANAYIMHHVSSLHCLRVTIGRIYERGKGEM